MLGSKHLEVHVAFLLPQINHQPSQMVLEQETVAKPYIHKTRQDIEIVE
jgi:hypothetical protein